MSAPNELLYTIGNGHQMRMFPVTKGEDGYPILVSGKTYYYGENYTEFTGSISDLHKIWPTSDLVPNFYEQKLVLHDPNDITGIDTVYYRLNGTEPIYYIDLNTRTVEAPEFISVLKDHNAEVIWFKVDRFYDDVDLFGSTCWIQYKNALKEDYVAVTIPKLIDDNNHDVLYIPWPISGAAAKAAGNLEFSFQFFKTEDGNSNKVYYSIHTKAATTKILHGLHVDLDKFLENENINDANYNPQYSEFLKDYQLLTEAYTTLVKDYNIYWIEA